MDVSTPVKRYIQSPPTEQDLFGSLDRFVGQEESRRLWSAACRQAGLTSSAALSVEQLERALNALKQVKGLASIAASSTLVRVKSYRTLSILHSK